MADLFQITPPVIRAEGKDVPPEQIQAGFNSLARQTQLALNTVGSDPTGPAGGDLSGSYPNPTVTGSHIASGTVSGVVVTGSTLDSTPIGGASPNTGAFTTLTATTPVGAASGGTGQNTLSAHNVLIGEGTGAVGFAAPSTAGKMLISQGAAVDPAFANNPAVIGGTVDSTPVGGTTPSTGAFTTLSASSGLNSTAVGNTTPSTGAFTTLSATSTVSGAGFTARFASPGPIGNTAASTGAFTTLSSTGTFTPSSTNGIVGTTTNDNANAGSVGEYITATGTGVSLTTGTNTNITSISLTAGDWDVWGNTVFIPAGSTVAGAAGFYNGVSLTSGNVDAVPSYSSLTGVTFATGNAPTLVAPTRRFSFSITTTVFLVAQANFTVSTMTATGIIGARRRR